MTDREMTMTLDEILDAVAILADVQEPRKEGEFTRAEFSERYHLSPSNAARRLDDLVRERKLKERRGPREQHLYRINDEP